MLYLCTVSHSITQVSNVNNQVRVIDLTVHILGGVKWGLLQFFYLERIIWYTMTQICDGVVKK